MILMNFVCDVLLVLAKIGSKADNHEFRDRLEN